MAYAPTNWVDNVTPVDAARMNNIEQRLVMLDDGIQYENVWAAGTPYNPGDVVSYGGVQYLAVNPSTGVTPSGGATGVGYVPQDAVTVAGVRLVSTKLLSTDAQPAFRIMGDGKHEWGPGGATVPDTTLLRSSPGTLKLQGTFFAEAQVAATDTVLVGSLVGDGAIRFLMQADGKMLWGPGNAGRDTNLYRSGAGVLKTDSYFSVYYGIALDLGNGGSRLNFGTSADTYLYRSAVARLQTDGIFATGSAVYALAQGIPGAEAFATYLPAGRAFYITGDGHLGWAAAGAATDCFLYRASANNLKTDGSFLVGPYLGFNPDGHMYFGDGAGAWDTNLFRPGANSLRTDDLFYAAGGIELKAKAGAPVDGDFAALGTIICYDTTNHQIYVRDSGVWRKTAALT